VIDSLEPEATPTMRGRSCSQSPLLTSVVVAAGFLVYAAPILFAEVILDAAIVGGLMRRLRGVEPQSWAVGAIRRTWLVAVGLAVVLAVLGWAMATVVPGARSLGDVLRAS
jgi:hypothetical protein